MIRRLILAGAVSAAGFGGAVAMGLAGSATHVADGSVCVNAQLNVAGNQVVNQSQCESLPSAPTP